MTDLNLDDVADVSADILHCLGYVMEASFDALGEGVMMGTMPAYMEQLGIRNSKFLRKRYVKCDPMKGAVSALSPMGLVSATTVTPNELVRAEKGIAVKRLKACEFQDAMDGRSDLAKAMMCQLHRSVYQGSVNALLDDPQSDGYNVKINSRILFGDPHCDFEVTSIPRREGPDKACPNHTEPKPGELEQQGAHFYGAILVSFVHYMLQVLPREQVDEILAGVPKPKANARLSLANLKKTVGTDLKDAAIALHRAVWGGDE